jgi:hypothetical protein
MIFEGAIRGELAGRQRITVFGGGALDGARWRAMA